MSKKVKITLYIDKDVVIMAKEIGLNLSLVAENTLKNQSGH